MREDQVELVGLTVAIKERAKELHTDGLIDRRDNVWGLTEKAVNDYQVWSLFKYLSGEGNNVYRKKGVVVTNESVEDVFMNM